MSSDEVCFSKSAFTMISEVCQCQQITMKAGFYFAHEFNSSFRWRFLGIPDADPAKH